MRHKDTAGSGDLHRREEVEKLLLNSKSLSQFQDKMKSGSTAPYRLPGVYLSRDPGPDFDLDSYSQNKLETLWIAASQSAFEMVRALWLILQVFLTENGALPTTPYRDDDKGSLLGFHQLTPHRFAIDFQLIQGEYSLRLHLQLLAHAGQSLIRQMLSLGSFTMYRHLQLILLVITYTLKTAFISYQILSNLRMRGIYG